jgi:AraC-like DNA-binding protein
VGWKRAGDKRGRWEVGVNDSECISRLLETSLLDGHRAGKTRFNHIYSKILSEFQENEYHSVRSLAQELDVSLSTVHTRLTDMLGFSLRHTRWISHSLTDELKATRVAASMKMFEILKQ